MPICTVKPWFKVATRISFHTIYICCQKKRKIAWIYRFRVNFQAGNKKYKTKQCQNSKGYNVIWFDKNIPLIPATTGVISYSSGYKLVLVTFTMVNLLPTFRVKTYSRLGLKWQQSTHWMITYRPIHDKMKQTNYFVYQ